MSTKKNADGDGAVDTIRLVKDYTQISPEEKVEIADACGDVRDEVRTLEVYLAETKAAAKRLEAALRRLPLTTP